ncbi:SGNH/GDSL hydrolase family protein [Pseudomonas sp. NPDC088429]|uniref:SGNH/GDSL hydrolase family protein n=1 Tax=Pseudomonas sp. NPDC088429 TaxID=3364455 RepID=UPI003823EAC1
MTPVLVLGDSHALVFSSEKMTELFPEHSFEVTSVGGATVSGLKNPNAVTQAMPQYLAALEATNAKTAIVMLGEVDTGFVIWYRAQKHGSAVDQMLEQAITNYQKLLRDLAKTFDVICVSTPLPTIQDDVQWGEVANLRKEVTASLAERTELTIKFNRMMGAFCDREGVSHLNFDHMSLDDTGVLKNHLRNPDPGNHHYDPAAHAVMIEPRLRPLLARCRHTTDQSAAPDSTTIQVKRSPFSMLWRLFQHRQ